MQVFALMQQQFPQLNKRADNIDRHIDYKFRLYRKILAGVIHNLVLSLCIQSLITILKISIIPSHTPINDQYEEEYK